MTETHRDRPGYIAWRDALNTGILYIFEHTEETIDARTEDGQIVGQYTLASDTGIVF